MSDAVNALVITGAAGSMDMLRLPVPAPLALVALIVTEDVPELVGVPEITPVVPPTVKGLGRPVAPKVVGLLVAVIV